MFYAFEEFRFEKPTSNVFILYLNDYAFLVKKLYKIYLSLSHEKYFQNTKKN